MTLWGSVPSLVSEKMGLTEVKTADQGSPHIWSPRCQAGPWWPDSAVGPQSRFSPPMRPRPAPSALWSPGDSQHPGTPLPCHQSKKLHDGTSSAPPLQGVQVWSLVRELSSCLLPGTAKKQNNNNKNLPKDQSPVHPSCRYKSSRYKSVLCKHGTKNSSGLLGTVSLNRKHFCVCVCVGCVGGVWGVCGVCVCVCGCVCVCVCDYHK